MAESIYQIAPSPNKAIGCQDLLRNGATVHSGWLRRQSLRNKFKIFTWPQVYVVISGGCVYCYSSETAKKPATSFSLYGYDKVFRSGEVSMKEATWAFKLVHANSDYRSYLFSASSEKEMAAWMKLFKQELLRASGKLSRTQGDGRPKSFEMPVYQDAGSESACSITSEDYMDIETNIYEDSSQFVIPTGYRNKKEDEDSDDEMNVVVTTRPDLQDRPPLPPPVPHRPHDSKNKHKNTPQENAFVYTEAPSSTSVKIKQETKPQPQVDRASKPTVAIRRGCPEGRSFKKDDSAESSQDSDSDTGNFWSTIFFYGGKEKASEIISQMPDDGVYLVRVNEDKSMVLHVYSNNKDRKFAVFKVDKEYTLQKESGHNFKRVEELVFFYYTHPLPKQEPEVYLTTCYVQHPRFRSVELT